MTAPVLKKRIGRRDLVILGFTAWVLCGGGGALVWTRTRQAVWFLNGLDVPVEVEVDGARFEVGAQQRTRRSMTTGFKTVSVRAGGTIIEEAAFDVSPMTSLVAYNVLGVAPLYLESIVYSNVQNDTGGSGTFLGGATAVHRDEIDYVFKDPPTSIEVKGGGRISKSHVDVAPGGWPSTLSYFMGQGDYVGVARILRSVSHAEPTSANLGRLSNLVGIGMGPSAELEMLREARDRRPTDIDAHFAYQRAMRRFGRGAEALREYRERLAKDPSSPDAGALAAVLEDASTAASLLDELVGRFPAAPLPREAAARFALQHDDPARAADLLSRGAVGLRSVDEQAKALAALGKLDQAIAVLAQAQGTDPSEELWVDVLHAEAIAAAHSTALRLEPKDEGSRAWMHSVLGDDGKAPAKADGGADPLAAVVEIHRLGLRDPIAARDALAAASPITLRQVHPVIVTLLAAELARVGYAGEAARLLAITEVSTVPDQALIDYVTTGAVSPDLWRIDPEQRAALDFVRARGAAERGESTTALLASVRAHDPLQGPVHTALTRWPLAAPPVGAIVALRKP